MLPYYKIFTLCKAKTSSGMFTNLPKPKMATITKIKEIEQNVIKISKILDLYFEKEYFWSNTEKVNISLKLNICQLADMSHFILKTQF